ncbi:MAG TPA: carbohydrate ABC transporter permease, partial [Bacteroidales bacterium]|nr:carbohydrate ABC transporter permease [Bacteroidales bacterium]
MKIRADNRTRKKSNKWGKIIRRILLIIFCLFSIFPCIWMIIISLKERIYTYDPSKWLFPPTLENYVKVFRERNLGPYFFNSIIVSALNCLISVILGSITAYGLARYKFKRSETTAFFLLAIRMLPPMGIVIPFFVIATLLRITDTRLILIICYMIFNIPFATWMMRGFFEDIPREIEEAAKVDGCSTLQTLRKVVVPLAMPGLVATSIFCVINAWNEFVYALFLTSFRAMTIPTIV